MDDYVKSVFKNLEDDIESAGDHRMIVDITFEADAFNDYLRVVCQAPVAGRTKPFEINDIFIVAYMEKAPAIKLDRCLNRLLGRYRGCCRYMLNNEGVFKHEELLELFENIFNEWKDKR